MRPVLRFAFLAVLIGGMTLAVSSHAGAQVTDEDHADCAQGGGFGSPLSGAGEGSRRSVGPYTSRLAHFGALTTNAAADDDGGGASGSDGGGGGGEGGGASGGSFLSDFAHAAAHSENQAGAGEAGTGKELGNGGLGASNLGGGAGGCDAPPRRLPATGGGGTIPVAYMGAAFILVGVVLLAGKRGWESLAD